MAYVHVDTLNLEVFSLNAEVVAELTLLAEEVCVVVGRSEGYPGSTGSRDEVGRSRPSRFAVELDSVAGF